MFDTPAGAIRAAANIFAGIGGGASTVTDIFANRYPTFRAGVQFNIPLGNKTAKAQLGRSLVEGERIKTQREQVEQNIQVDVRNSLQAVRTSEARLRSAAISRENSVKQYESEQRKLDAGQSNLQSFRPPDGSDNGTQRRTSRSNRTQQSDCRFTASDGQSLKPTHRIAFEKIKFKVQGQLAFDLNLELELELVSAGRIAIIFNQ